MTRKLYTIEECKKSFQKYTCIRDIRNSVDAQAYHSAKYYGWLVECKKHMKDLHPAYTYESCKSIFLSFKYISDLQKKHGGAWNWAFKNNHLEEFTSHMSSKKVTKDGTYTKNYLQQLFLKFDRLEDLRAAHSGAYQTAHKKGWLKELTSHMHGFGNSSTMEEELRKHIKQHYPSVCSKWFGSCKKGEIAKRFQLDLYIPELNVAIEFNGDYYHSYNALKRSKPTWPDSMIQQYHDIKRDFFAKLGIAYIEIWEHEWNADYLVCLTRALRFLNSKRYNTNRNLGEYFG